MTRARRFVLALVAFAAATLLAGSALAAPIRLWHAYRGKEERALESLVKQYAPGEVELLALPYDAFGSKLAAAIPLGEGPDLFIDAHERLGDYRARQLVAPVGDALDEAAPFSSPALEAVKLDGKAYAVPLSQKCLALYVNTDLVQHDPRELEDIVALRATLPKDVFPLAYEAQGAYAHAAVLSAFGGAMLGKDDQLAFVGPAAEASVDLVRSLLEQRVVPEDADGSLVTNLFKSGKAAFAISGPWLAADLGEAKSLHYRVALLPRIRRTGQLMRPYLTVESVMMSP